VLCLAGGIVGILLGRGVSVAVTRFLHWPDIAVAARGHCRRCRVGDRRNRVWLLSGLEGFAARPDRRAALRVRRIDFRTYSRESQDRSTGNDEFLGPLDSATTEEPFESDLTGHQNDIVRRSLRLGRTRSRRLEHFFQLFAGAVVVLGDGELEGVFEDRFGFGRTTEGNQRFAELDVDDHPIRFLVAQRAEMFDGVGEPRWRRSKPARD